VAAPHGPIRTGARHPAVGARAGGPGLPGVQTLLLGLGALLLVVAATVFAAVVWDRLGALGQVALMATATLLVAWLAVRLRHRLHGTAEALAVVAAGLLVVDLAAAPLLGLLPEEWMEQPGPYPAAALGLVGALLLALSRRFGLVAWEWLGWLALPAAGALLAMAWADQHADDRTWTAAGIAIPAVISIGLLAGSRFRWRDWGSAAPMWVAGGIGLAGCAMATIPAALSRASLPGALVTTGAAAAAWCAWAWFDHDRLVRAGAAGLVGTAVGLVLLLPGEPQPLWLAALVGLLGIGLGLLAHRLTGDRESTGLAALSLWLVWSVGRMTSIQPVTGSGDVLDQLALLAVVVAVVCVVVTRWAAWAAWAAALLAQFAHIVVMPDTWDVLEAWTWPFAALLLGAGLLWRRFAPEPVGSLLWLGPAVAMALLPSAVLTWGAPWVGGAAESGSADVTTALLRLGFVLVAGVAASVVGARMGLAGLLLPGAAAVAIAAAAQVWSGLASLPRWIGLGLAGTALVLAGARIEWLRGEGGRARAWLRELR
jgi:hypothetical protein